MNLLKLFKIKKTNTSISSVSPRTDNSPSGNAEYNNQELTISAPDFSNTHQSIMDIWNKIGATPCTVETDTIFYSGIRSKSPIVNIDEILKNRKNLWMSQSAYYAGGYCYREHSPAVHSALLKLRFTRPMPVLAFPYSFHPATAFFDYVETKSGFEVDYSRPAKYKWFKDGQVDHHIDVYFRDIVKYGNFKIEPTGHIRKAIKHDLGAIPGEIIELYTSDLSAIEIIDWIAPPATKVEYNKLIGLNHLNAASILFP